jgi:redox-sensitive bicupin YhaK (pirin superfamily)
MNTTTKTEMPITTLATVFPSMSLPVEARKTVIKTHGQTHGPITRLMSPNDLGQEIKPFIFLDRGVIRYTGHPLFGIHPHSGIATLTTVLTGGITYEDTTGKSGTVMAGGIEWMKAGNGVWHDGGVVEGEPTHIFQLWLALPPDQENAAPESQYIDASEIQSEGPVRVLMGSYGEAKSLLHAPDGMNYYHVTLKAGEKWTYVPPEGHTVAWLAVDQGKLCSDTTVGTGEIAIYEESSAPIEIEAEADASFVFGSAVKHPHSLVTGMYSVHTTEEALVKGEQEIRRIGRELRAKGRL